MRWARRIAPPNSFLSPFPPNTTCALGTHTPKKRACCDFFKQNPNRETKSCFSSRSSCPQSGFGIMHRGAAWICEGGMYVAIQWGSDGREILAKRDHVGDR